MSNWGSSRQMFRHPAVLVFMLVMGSLAISPLVIPLSAGPVPEGVGPAMSGQPQGMVLGDTWTRPADGMVMVFVPSGEFQMGSEDGDSDERPVHTVALDAFWLDCTEVTNAQYRQCVAAGACEKSMYADDATYNGDSQPVVGVDWNDANGYCQWAGKRLPTEAEWEYAARGPEGSVYPWGNTFDAKKLNAEGAADGYTNTAPVGSFPDGASWCGVLDLAGNVWEWTADWYGDYPSGPQTNPTGPGSGSSRVLRGGSWADSSLAVRGAYRSWGIPDNWFGSLGFHCARNP